MLNIRAVETKDEIEVKPQSIQIDFDDNAELSLSVLIPPIGEFPEVGITRVPQISIRELASRDTLGIKAVFQQELAKFKKKLNRFRHSSTFFTRLADLSSLSGQIDQAESFIRNALELSSSPSLKHQLCTYLIEQNRTEDAMQVYEQCDLNNDIHANLRVAYIFARQNQLSEARRYVDRALAIDPADFGSRMFAGAIHLWHREYQFAIRSFRIAAAQNEHSALPHLNLAAAHTYMGQRRHAVRALRQAIVLNPLNENALIFFADLMLLVGRNKDAIPPLKNFVEFEQKTEAIWDRLARAYFIEGSYREALAALKEQEQVAHGCSVFNNLGLVFWKRGDTVAAGNYLMKALREAETDKACNIQPPVLNLLGMLIEKRQFKEAHSISKQFINDETGEWKKSKLFPQLYLKYLITLDGLGNPSGEVDDVKRTLDAFVETPEIRLLGLIYLMHYHSNISPSADMALKYAYEALGVVEKYQFLGKLEKVRAINNVIFAFLSAGKVSEAAPLIGHLSESVHADPYVTATLGLFNLQKGRIDRGKAFYEEAIRLARDVRLKHLIRQRMALELGKIFVRKGQHPIAKKWFDKAAREKLGHEQIKKQALALSRAH